MSGGSEKIRFYSSFGYQNNPGVMDNTGFENIAVDSTLQQISNLG